MALQKLTFCGPIAYLSSGESSPIVFSLLTVCTTFIITLLF
ncbi:hypothetical protein HMPREF3226_02722 [Prevotella corporis]|uniref:Uncharacterized protein n=1 Tax=Prevotella corporis TaxID=28128 RepID=A0A133PTR5_9BACT|nr:hypothetical protein HMPREF3226_02722 [Prevotella corporis]